MLALAPNLKAQGGGELTFFGISVYDGYYWSPTRGWTQDGPFALDLHYHRALDGAKIAERSVSEIAKLGYGTLEQRVRWGEEMRRMFPEWMRAQAEEKLASRGREVAQIRSAAAPSDSSSSSG